MDRADDIKDILISVSRFARPEDISEIMHYIGWLRDELAAAKRAKLGVANEMKRHCLAIIEHGVSGVASAKQIYMGVNNINTALLVERVSHDTTRT